MTSKKANWLFLTIILVHIGVVTFLIFGGENITIGIVSNFLLSEGILMVPALLFLLLFRDRRNGAEVPGQTVLRRWEEGGCGVQSGCQAEAAVFRRVKISTLLMIILCTFLIMPLVTVLNTLTMFFTDNTVAALQGDILDTPFLIMLFMIGIFGPFCEEFVFRGIMYRSYRRSAGIGAVLLSAFAFGLMHMNFNQALYAFGIGIFLAVLVEAAGSLWASMCCHMFFNSFEVVLMYLSGRILDSAYGQAVTEAAGEMTAQDLMAALSVYLVIAAVTTPIAVCVIAWIAKNEGRQEAMRVMLSDPNRRTGRKRGYLLSAPLVVGVVFCLGYMSLDLFL